MQMGVDSFILWPDVEVDRHARACAAWRRLCPLALKPELWGSEAAHTDYLSSIIRETLEQSFANSQYSFFILLLQFAFFGEALCKPSIRRHQFGNGIRKLV